MQIRPRKQTPKVRVANVKLLSKCLREVMSKQAQFIAFQNPNYHDCWTFVKLCVHGFNSKTPERQAKKQSPERVVFVHVADQFDSGRLRGSQYYVLVNAEHLQR